MDDSIALHKAGTIDHAPVALEIMPRRMMPAHTRPIAKEVFMDSRYPSMLQRAIDMDRLMTRPV